SGCQPAESGAGRGNPHLRLGQTGRPPRDRLLAGRSRGSRHPPARSQDARELARGNLRVAGAGGTAMSSEGRTMGAAMNIEGVKAIYRFEMARAFRTWIQSIVSPVLSTSL